MRIDLSRFVESEEQEVRARLERSESRIRLADARERAHLEVVRDDHPAEPERPANEIGKYGFRERHRQVRRRVERGNDDMRAHHRRHARGDRGEEGCELDTFERWSVDVDLRRSEERRVGKECRYRRRAARARYTES